MTREQINYELAMLKLELNSTYGTNIRATTERAREIYKRVHQLHMMLRELEQPE